MVLMVIDGFDGIKKPSKPSKPSIITINQQGFKAITAPPPLYIYIYYFRVCNIYIVVMVVIDSKLKLLRNFSIH